MTDTLGSVNDGYFRLVLNDGHIDLLKEPIERCETYQEVEYSLLVGRSAQPERCVEVH